MKVQLLTLVVSLCFHTSLFSQAVEFYGGHKRSGVDILWYRFIQNKTHENTPFLFFSRNRASVDYENPFGAFGSVSALSYNLKNGLGFVGVGTILNSGFIGKIGLQLYKQKGDFMFFGWAVADLKNAGNIDVFGLFRYTPKINEKLKLFTQMELFPVFSPSQKNWNLTQRFRLGLKYNKYAFGLMADFNQVGKSSFQTTQNVGAFIRHDF